LQPLGIIVSPRRSYQPLAGELRDLTITSRVDHRKDPVYISPTELKSPEKQKKDAQFHQSRIEKRSELHTASRQRAKNWNHTVEGLRRQKLDQMNSKFNVEEEERVKVDAVFARDEKERRDRTMGRARQLIYNELDETKQLHSKIRLFEVLEVRKRLLTCDCRNETSKSC
jgi:hypothetical protein